LRGLLAASTVKNARYARFTVVKDAGRGDSGFKSSGIRRMSVEAVHPLEGGAFRRKPRRDRRQGLRLESPFVFYSGYAGEIAFKAGRYWSVYRQARAILNEVLGGSDRWTYSDIAIAPSGEDEFGRARSVSRDRRRRGCPNLQASSGESESACRMKAAPDLYVGRRLVHRRRRHARFQ
jgi:hypothetical protein